MLALSHFAAWLEWCGGLSALSYRRQQWRKEEMRPRPGKKNGVAGLVLTERDMT
jgi:hypothetical protein